MQTEILEGFIYSELPLVRTSIGGRYTPALTKVSH